MPYAVSLTKNVYDAQDLVQDTILKMLTMKHIPTNRDDISRLMRWSMRNIFISGIRKATCPMRTGDLRDMPRFERPVAEGLLTAKEIMAAVGALKGKKRVIMDLVIIGHGQTGISKLLNTPRNTIGPYLHHARKELAKQLA